MANLKASLKTSETKNENFKAAMTNLETNLASTKTEKSEL